MIAVGVQAARKHIVLVVVVQVAHKHIELAVAVEYEAVPDNKHTVLAAPEQPDYDDTDEVPDDAQPAAYELART